MKASKTFKTGMGLEESNIERLLESNYFRKPDVPSIEEQLDQIDQEDVNEAKAEQNKEE